MQTTRASAAARPVRPLPVRPEHPRPNGVRVRVRVRVHVRVCALRELRRNLCINTCARVDRAQGLCDDVNNIVIKWSCAPGKCRAHRRRRRATTGDDATTRGRASAIYLYTQIFQARGPSVPRVPPRHRAATDAGRAGHAHSCPPNRSQMAVIKIIKRNALKSHINRVILYAAAAAVAASFTRQPADIRFDRQLRADTHHGDGVLVRADTAAARLNNGGHVILCRGAIAFNNAFKTAREKRILQ